MIKEKDYEYELKLFELNTFNGLYKPLILSYDNKYYLNIVTLTDHDPHKVYGMNSEYAKVHPYKRLGEFNNLEEIIKKINKSFILDVSNDVIEDTFDDLYLNQLIEITDSNIDLTISLIEEIGELSFADLECLELKNYYNLRLKAVNIKLTKYRTTTKGKFNKSLYHKSLIQSLYNNCIMLDKGKLYLWLTK